MDKLYIYILCTVLTLAGALLILPAIIDKVKYREKSTYKNIHLRTIVILAICVAISITLSLIKIYSG